MVDLLTFDEKISITDLISLCSLVISLITFFVLLFQRRNDTRPDVRLDLEAKDEKSISKKFDVSLFERRASQKSPILLLKSVNSNVPKLVTVSGFIYVNPAEPQGNIERVSSDFSQYSNPAHHATFALRTAFRDEQFWNLDKGISVPIGFTTQLMFEVAAYLEIQQFLKKDVEIIQAPRLVFSIDYCDYKNRHYFSFYSVLLEFSAFEFPSLLVYSPKISEISQHEFTKYQKAWLSLDGKRLAPQLTKTKK